MQVSQPRDQTQSLALQADCLPSEPPWKPYIYLNIILIIYFSKMYPYICMCAQSCPTLCDPTDCSPPGSSRGSSQPRDQTHVSCITGGFFTAEPPEKPQRSLICILCLVPNSIWGNLEGNIWYYNIRKIDEESSTSGKHWFKKMKLPSGVRGWHKVPAETSCHLPEMSWKCDSELPRV